MGRSNSWSGRGNQSPLTSTTLLGRVRARDPDGWQQLVDIYAPLVYSWCRRSGLQAADAGEVVQEVFTSVFQSLDHYRGSQRQGSFRAWLRTITRRRMSDYLERRGSAQAVGGSTAQQQLVNLPETLKAAPTAEGGSESDFILRRALDWLQDKFEPRTWRAFWRVVIDHQRPTDVAQEMGMTLWAVYKAKSRVLRRMREELQGLEEI